VPGVHSGRLAIKHEDGTEVEIGPGAAYVIEPGHDAGVVGDERRIRVRVAIGGGTREGLKRASRWPDAGLTVATDAKGASEFSTS
jgi:hypothetical protein